MQLESRIVVAHQDIDRCLCFVCSYGFTPAFWRYIAHKHLPIFQCGENTSYGASDSYSPFQNKFKHKK